MENLGEYLQQARKAKKLSIEEMASQTRISVRFIEAIEGNRIDLLPNLVSAKGFVRGYALCLELDTEEVLEAFSELVGSAGSRKGKVEGDEAPPYIQEERPDRLPFPSWPVMSIGALIVLLLILAVVLPKKSEEDPRPSEETTPMEEAISPEVPQVFEPPDLETSVQDENIPEADDVSEGEAPLIDVTEKELPLTDLLPDQASEPESDPRPEGVASASVLIVEAISSSWVQVTIDGNDIREAMLQPSDTVRWRAKESFFLTLGNAGGVRVYLDGKDLGPMGPLGKVVRKEFVIAENLPE